jgi:hypothetical protein
MFGMLLLLLLSTGADSVPTSATLTLGWDYTQAQDPAVVFTLYRALDCASYTPLATLPTSIQQYTDTVPVGSRICWQVDAKDAAGVASLPSNTLAVLCKRQGQRVTCPVQERGNIH